MTIDPTEPALAGFLARDASREQFLDDLQPLLQSYAGRGSRAYHPALLLRIVLYQLACGVHQGTSLRTC